MAVEAAGLYSTSGISPALVTPAKRSYQALKPTQASASNTDQVVLTSEAKAKAMKLAGYSVAFISAKLGLDTKTINQYLGITATANDAIFKTTYTPPKPAYTEPKSTDTAQKATYTEPQTLTHDRTSLANDLAQLSTVQKSTSPLIDSTSKKAT